jgi:hypothetical protein
MSENILNWELAEEYLKECEAAYAEIGRSGLLALILTIMPLRDRFNKGERTQELYDEIMEIAL